ncbi:hypothetical protein GQ457_08G025340 [Hibiscus cannabinus]
MASIRGFGLMFGLIKIIHFVTITLDKGNRRILVLRIGLLCLESGTGPDFKWYCQSIFVKIDLTATSSQRVCTFIWFAVHGKTLTNHERLRRYLSTSDTCFLCHNGIEDVVRVLRDCVQA